MGGVGVRSRWLQSGKLRGCQEWFQGHLIMTVRAQAKGELGKWWTGQRKNEGLKPWGPAPLWPVALAWFFSFFRLIWLNSIWFFIKPDLSFQLLFHLPKMNIFPISTVFQVPHSFKVLFQRPKSGLSSIPLSLGIQHHVPYFPGLYDSRRKWSVRKAYINILC